MTQEPNIDLHTHSTCSDGSLTSGALVARAAAAGVEVLALTDHDSIAGLAEALETAGRLGYVSCLALKSPPRGVPRPSIYWVYG